MTTIQNEVLTAIGSNPIVLEYHYAVEEGETLPVAAAGFRLNDLVPDGGTLSGLSLSEDVDNGDLSALTTGDLTYTPDPGFVGVDSFKYTAVDAGGKTTGPVTVWIGIYSTNIPIAQGDTVSTAEDAPVTSGVLENDIDPNDDPLSIASFG